VLLILKYVNLVFQLTHDIYIDRGINKKRWFSAVKQNKGTARIKLVLAILFNLRQTSNAISNKNIKPNMSCLPSS
jgi:hypothetical protein